MLQLLGCGGCGYVNLVEHDTGIQKKYYALKALSKGGLQKMGQLESILHEKTVLSVTDSPFIVKLYAAYNEPEMVFFLLELALGGDLFSVYLQHAFYGSLHHARVYIASVACALAYLHERHIIYRDLKPENLLITADGHLKLTDMGLSKIVLGKAYTTLGTPEYLAPEMILSLGHNAALDWWTLGILTFELMCGYTPFVAATPASMFKKIELGIDRVKFPPKASATLKDLISKMLKANPGTRLPMQPGGIVNFEQHRWFQDFVWDALRNHTLESPYKPCGHDSVVEYCKANFSASIDDRPLFCPFNTRDGGEEFDIEFG